MRKLINLLIAVTFLVGISPGVFAGVSTSAVLFLRIAAGARAAGMGEAFVAVADDATTTHWNPAGLGNYPLSSKWFEVSIPEDLRPFKKVAFYQNNASEIDYNKYDIWAISENGLVRYSRNKWYRGEIIETRAEQSAESILRDYTGMQSEENDVRIAELMNVIGDANNDKPRNLIDSIELVVMPQIPEDSGTRDEIENGFIAIKAAYNQCLIDWDRFKRIGVEYRNAIKDSILSESELDRLLYSIEKTKMRVLAEEILVPFAVNFDGQLTDIVSDKKYLWVSSESGLYRYNRKRWRHFETNENMPSSNISNIELNKKKTFICTDSGLVIYDNGIFIFQDENVGLPSMPIMGVAPLSNNTAWAVVEGDLYHFDGKMWKNYIEFQDVLDQTAESIYDNMKIFDNADEKSTFLEKFGSLNGDELTQTDSVPSDSNKQLGDISKLIDSVGTIKALEIMQDSLVDIQASQAKLEEQEELSNDSTQAETDAPVKIGKTIKVPYTAGIPFEITAMKVDNNKNLWIGTEFGLLKFNGHKWKWYGYRNYVVEQEMTIDELALSLVDDEKRRADRLAVNIKEVNRLQSDILVAGQKIKTYANPGGSRIHDICPMGDKIYFGTEGGTIFYENGWSRFNDEGLGGTEVTRIAEVDNNMWFASNDKVLIRAAARSEIAFMVAKWLPQLADDMYYNYLSVVFNPKGWGTIGVSATFLTYGTIIRTNSSGEVEGDFSPFDFAATISYGTSLSKSLSGGISTKIIYSHLSRLGAGSEQGEGTATAIGFDIGLFYRINRKLALGLAMTNLGPSVSYIDVDQSDPLPRNLSIGLAWKLVESNYNRLLFTIEMNKSMAAIGNLADEFKEIVINGGAEYWYGSFIALRLGYIYDQEGEIKTPTLGFGLAYKAFEFNFAYIPTSENLPLGNTMRVSIGAKL